MEFHDRDDAELAYEDALLLLEEVEDAVDELEDADERDGERREHLRTLLERLLADFEELPLTSKLAREHMESVESWGELLLSEDGEGAGPGSSYQLLRDELTELRGFLEYELTI